MKIEADEPSISELFNNGAIVFYVPVYQRRYAWGEDQWKNLWDDVNDLAEDDSHFIGSVVVIREGAVVRGFNEMELVDGQQRLATISILLCALRDSYSDRGDQVQAERVRRLYLHSESLSGEMRKLTLGKFDDDAYQNLLLGRPAAGHKVTEAYEFFKDKIQTEPDLGKVSYRFTNGIKLVIIYTESHQDAFKLFETLNDRGLELSAVDLIKNRMLNTAANRPGGSTDFMVEAWEDISEKLDGLDNIRFFRQFLLANYTGKVTQSALYEKYKTLISNGQDLDDFVSRLGDAAGFYNDIHHYSSEDPALNFKLEDLINLKATTSFTLLLRVLADGWPAPKILSVIPAIEAFSLRRAICGWSTTDMDTIYNQISNLPVAEREPKQICEMLSKNMPDDRLFRENFRTNRFRQDTQTKYVLEQFEYRRQNTGEMRIADRRAVHIEHIMPQTISGKKQGGDWATYLGPDAERHDEYFQLVGNLTLLGAELNVPASNNPFLAKKGFYQRSEIKLTKELCDFDDWRIPQIAARSEALAEEATRIWRIESDSVRLTEANVRRSAAPNS